MTLGGLVLAAPAKVNLFLEVGDVRADGYHEVDTVMLALALHDTVSLAPSGRLEVSCEPDVGVAPEDNIAARAARALAARLGREPDAAIRIRKRIPSGAGLGGGSSDAAAVLAGLASMWGLDDAGGLLADVAAGLGADVPFFLEGGCALMSGRGDVFVSRLPAVPMHVALVNPGVPVATPDAYAAFDAHRPPEAADVGPMLAALQTADPARIAAALHDNLTAPVAGLVPAVAEALAFVSERSGLLGACMAGSGSTVFGVFEDAGHAEETAVAARECGWWSEATMSRAGGVSPVGDGEEERA